MSDSSAALYLENQLCFPLYATSRLTTKIYGPFLKELDLTYPQYLVMLVMWQHGAQTVNSIGQHILLESNTITPLLKRLEQKQLITRSRSDSDERSVIIALTEKGILLKEKAIDIPGKILASFNDDSIQKTELIAFQKTLFRLMNVLNRKTNEQGMD